MLHTRLQLRTHSRKTGLGCHKTLVCEVLGVNVGHIASAVTHLPLTDGYGHHTHFVYHTPTYDHLSTCAVYVWIHGRKTGLSYNKTPVFEVLGVILGHITSAVAHLLLTAGFHAE